MTRRTEARGFTLVELMMVVAIIGILTTVAFPGFQHVVLRSRAAERRVVMDVLKKAVDDVYLQRGRLEAVDGTPLTGGITCAFNPAGTPTTYKRAFVPTYDNWAKLVPPNFTAIEGNLYYSYELVVVDTDELHSLLVQAKGDLDGDGIASDTIAYYVREGGVFQLDTSVSTPIGSEDPVSF